MDPLPSATLLSTTERPVKSGALLLRLAAISIWIIRRIKSSKEHKLLALTWPTSRDSRKASHKVSCTWKRPEETGTRCDAASLLRSHVVRLPIL